jgi:superfamily II DNA or RNA helicase
MTKQLGLFGGPDMGWLDELDTPADPDGLRWYQRDAVSAAARAFESGDRSTLLVMATGTGKTQVFSAVAKHWPGNVLVLAHRSELVEQAAHRLEQMTGELVDVEQGQLRAGRHARLVVGSVDSIRQQKRLDRHGAERFDLVIVDEAHHYVAKTYKRPLEFFKHAKILGVTATPDRGDEKALGKLFDSVSYVFDIAEGVAQGYLCPLRGRAVDVEALDISNVDTVAGDLVAAQLDEAMLSAVEGVVQQTLALEPGRQGVAFFPGVRSAELAAERFNALAPGSACFVSGGTPPDDRKRIMADFKAGRYRYLCNCQVATEGFDAPAASLIIQARPTKSRALYAQMVGRGTRVLPGTVDHLEGRDLADARIAAVKRSRKPDCMILDFVGNSGKHVLATPEDLLGGLYEEDEVKRAKEIAKAEPGSDVGENLARARNELRAIAAKLKAGKVKAQVRPFDPFETFNMAWTDETRYSRYSAPATKTQLDVLKLKGVEERDLVGISKKAAKQLLAEIDRRRKLNLATYRQLRQLKKWGVARDDVPFSRAREALDYVDSTGWGRNGPVDPARLNAICYDGREPGED